MASEFVVKKGGAGRFELYVRDLLPHGEYKARFNHMVGEIGYTPDAAAEELYLMQKYHKHKHGAMPWDLCQKFIFDYATPGDILRMGGTFFVVNKPAIA